MSALTIAATALPTPAGARTRTKPAGETLTDGMPVYLHTDGKLYKTDVDGTAAAKACYGITMTGGILDDNIVVLLSCTGPLTICASGIVNGTIYCAGSATPGTIVPWADLDSSDTVIILGVGYSATELLPIIFDSGVTHA